MIRVLLVADSLDVGGAERHVVGLAAALCRYGHDVVIATSTAGSLAGIAQAAGVPVWPLLDHLVKRRLSVRYARALRALLSRGRFDVLHAHMYASVVAGALAAAGTGTSLIVTEHSEAAWRGWRARLISRIAYRRADSIIAVSDGVRQRLQEVDCVPPSRIRVIPNALPDLVPPRPSGDIPARKDGEVWIGVVARLQPEKGVGDFLVAAARVAASLPHAQFIIIGDGPDRAKLTILSRKLGLEGRVAFLGFRTDAQAILRHLDLLVVPSRSEGTPLVVLEAMQAGLPIVATCVGGIPAQIRHAREGLLVPPAHPDELADAIMTLANDPALAVRLGEAGRARLHTAFDHATMLRRTIAVYDSALRAARCRTAAVRESAST